MKVSTIVCIIIISLIVLFYITHNLHKNNKLPDGIFKESLNDIKNSATAVYDTYFTSSDALYKRITGYENNKNTKLALEKALKKDEMHTRNDLQGNLSYKNLNDAMVNSFYAGSIYQYNIATNKPTIKERNKTRQKAIKQYNKALEKIHRDPVAIITYNTETDPTAEFIIDRAEHFYEDYIDQLNIQDILFQNIDNLRNQVRNARVMVAKNSSNIKNISKKKKNNTIKQNQQDIYYDEKAIRNDPQNVHEPQVVNSMSTIYRTILMENDKDDFNNNNNYTIKDIQKYIQKYTFDDPSKKTRALKTLKKIEQGNLITKLSAAEDEILINIWKRINSPSNEKNQKNLKNALVTALVDSTEKNYQGHYTEVCAVGRITRILNSLTLIDSNKVISSPIKTNEIMKNEIFAKSYKIIQDKLKSAPKIVVNAYNGIIPEEDISQKLHNQVEELETNMKNSIEQIIKDDYPNVDSKKLDNFIKDAQAGV